MFSIFLLTLQRLREPAFIGLFAIGCLIAVGSARLDSFEAALDSPTRTLTGSPSASDPPAPPTEAGDKAKRVNPPPRSGRVVPLLLGTVMLILFGVLITVFNAASEIPRDIGSQMISVLLSKPLSRSDYLVGRALGNMGLGAGLTAIWLVLLLLTRQVLGGGGVELGLAGAAGQFLALLVFLPVTAVAVSISCLVNEVAAMVLSSIYLGCGIVAGVAPLVAALLPEGPASQVIIFGYLFFPNLWYFVLPPAAPAAIVALLGYGVALAAMFLALAKWEFATGDVYRNR